MTEAVDVVRLLDACRLARHAWSLLPKLPESLTGNHVRVIGVIHDREARNVPHTHASTIADTLEVARPGITRLLNELEAWGYVRREPDSTDRRRSTVALTAEGTSVAQEFVTDFHASLATQLADLTPEEIRVTISTIETLHSAIATLTHTRNHA